MTTRWALPDLLLALVLAPLLAGVVSRVKAIVAGRRGAPLFQLYFDLLKLLRKGAVYSETTTWVFRAGPVVALGASASALLLVPYAGKGAVVSFPVDFVLLAYLLALARFFTVSAALDTGSSFEGMGASREVLFAALCEPTLLHEVMVLDHGGPELAFMQYAASLRLWLWSALVVGLLAPFAASWPWLPALPAVLGIFLLAIAVGLVESGIARARLVRVPHLLTAASALAALAFILVLR